MSSKRKPFVVVTLTRGKKTLWSLDKDAAYKAAIAKGWLPVEVNEKKEEELKEAA